jgi:hypothetical protein
MAPRRRRLDVNVTKENDIISVIERRVDRKCREIETIAQKIDRSHPEVQALTAKDEKIFDAMWDSFIKKLATKFSILKDNRKSGYDPASALFYDNIGPLGSQKKFGDVKWDKAHELSNKERAKIKKLCAEFEAFVLKFHLAQMKEGEDTSALVEKFIQLLATY